MPKICNTKSYTIKNESVYSTQSFSAPLVRCSRLGLHGLPRWLLICSSRKLLDSTYYVLKHGSTQVFCFITGPRCNGKSLWSALVLCLGLFWLCLRCVRLMQSGGQRERMLGCDDVLEKSHKDIKEKWGLKD